jgi:hypothetical protein
MAVISALFTLERSTDRWILSPDERRLLRDLSEWLGGQSPQRLKEAPGTAFRDLAVVLFFLQGAVIDEILRAHPDGYSTTTRDLINDLLPF